MAKLETEHIFNGNIEKTYAGISQYSKYPDYLPGVTKIAVLPPQVEGSLCQVRYDLKIIKEFFYILDMFGEEPKKIWWQLSDSNIMKVNEGSWRFSKKGEGKTKAVYSLNVKLKGFVPSTITDQVAKTNLPAMLEGFQRLIDDFGG